MADEIDVAHEQERQMLEALLSSRVKYEGESALHCEVCGDEIPEARRTGIPGVQTCVVCQSRRERDARMHRR